MNEPNVQLGQIRLEDSFYEAKIHEPAEPNVFRCKCNAKVEQNDEKPTIENVLPVARNATKFRQG